MKPKHKAEQLTDAYLDAKEVLKDDPKLLAGLETRYQEAVIAQERRQVEINQRRNRRRKVANALKADRRSLARRMQMTPRQRRIADMRAASPELAGAFETGAAKMPST